MSPWVRKLFIQIMPKILMMRRPHYMPRYTSDLPEADKDSLIDNTCEVSNM